MFVISKFAYKIRIFIYFNLDTIFYFKSWKYECR